MGRCGKICSLNAYGSLFLTFGLPSWKINQKKKKKGFMWKDETSIQEMLRQPLHGNPNM
jgi:hypothetical protein